MLLLSCCAAASAYTLGATSRPAVQRWRAACGVQMFGSVEEIDKSQWCMKVDNAPGLVVVFFYARWCSNCKAVGPVYRRMAKEFSDATFYKVNFKQETELCYQARGRDARGRLVHSPTRTRASHPRPPRASP